MLEELTLEDIPKTHKDIAEYIGIDPFKKLVELLGGSSLYIPKEASLTRPIRNRVIRDKFNGDYSVLARKYDISEAQVRNIVGEMNQTTFT
ncbi:Mor transcription activator family protein [Paraclostridium bifermentans]|uniref:Mor transcription activator family protein n=1 Tax=Paraclostridium bifermentans TaxID=1490 RepID=UPI0022E6FB67|nr:Mor transcription activator family protein [Paraclostridium bifermentans]